ncbi:MAG: cytidine deaminase [Solobacterium sp.]|nr:cytidine deaminase [Solobacterium sp.]
MNREELIKEAFKAMENAYAPYSNYHVGAALLCHDGRVFIGANIENASFGATNCAERSAVFAAYSNGIRKDDIAALAIVSDGDRVCAPCGICRQVLIELIPQDCPIWLSNGTEDVDTTIRELVPMQFTEEDVIR